MPHAEAKRAISLIEENLDLGQPPTEDPEEPTIFPSIPFPDAERVTSLCRWPAFYSMG